MQLTASYLGSKQYPRQLQKTSGVIHQSSQQVRNWKMDYIGFLSSCECSKYTLVCMDTESNISPFAAQTRMAPLGD